MQGEIVAIDAPFTTESLDSLKGKTVKIDLSSHQSKIFKTEGFNEVKDTNITGKIIGKERVYGVEVVTIEVEKNVDGKIVRESYLMYLESFSKALHNGDIEQIYGESIQPLEQDNINPQILEQTEISKGNIKIDRSVYVLGDELIATAKANSFYKRYSREQKQVIFNNSRKHLFNGQSYIEDNFDITHPRSSVRQYLENLGINISQLKSSDKAVLITFIQELFFNCDPEKCLFSMKAIIKINKRINEASNPNEIEKLTRVKSVILQIIENTGNRLESSIEA